MGLVIAKGLIFIVVVLIVAAVIVYFRRRKSKETALERGWAIKGDLTKAQERVIIAQLNTADLLFRELLTPPRDLSGEMTLLRGDHRMRVESWLSRQNKTPNRKAIDNS